MPSKYVLPLVNRSPLVLWLLCYCCSYRTTQMALTCFTTCFLSFGIAKLSCAFCPQVNQCGYDSKTFEQTCVWNYFIMIACLSVQSPSTETATIGWMPNSCQAVALQSNKKMNREEINKECEWNEGRIIKRERITTVAASII